MAASVRIEDEAFSDVRYDVLASICGLADADHARGKMAKIWRQCTQQKVYALPASFVVSVLGEKAVAGLSESGLGEVSEDGIRICGTRGRIEWLSRLRKNATKGGKAKSAKRQASGSPEGKQEAAKSVPPPCPPAPAPAPEDQNPAASQPEPHQPAVAAFDAYYRKAHSGRKPDWNGVTIGMLKGLCKRLGTDEVVSRIGYLERSPPDFPRGGWDLKTFVGNVDKCVPSTTAPPANKQTEIRSNMRPL